MRFPLGEMTVGDILDRGLRMLFARLPVFYALHLIVLFPLITLQIAGPLILFHDTNTADLGAALGLVAFGLLAILFLLILQPIATAAILHIVMEEYAGRRASLSSALGFAVSRFLPLLGASILVGLLVLLGLFLCCVPGIYFWVTYIFVGQAVVLERSGIAEAFNRSQRLITGFWWRVFGVLLLILIAQRIVEWALALGLTVALPAQQEIPTEAGRQIKVNPLNHIVGTLATLLVTILFASYTAVCTTLLYLDLRIRKEGFDLELAAGGGPERDGRDRYDHDYRRRDRYDRDRDEDEYEDDYDDRDDRDRRPRARNRNYYDDWERDDYDDRDRDRPVALPPRGERPSDGEHRTSGSVTEETGGIPTPPEEPVGGSPPETAESERGHDEPPPGMGGMPPAPPAPGPGTERHDPPPAPGPDTERHDLPPPDRGPDPERRDEPPRDDRDRR